MSSSPDETDRFFSSDTSERRGHNHDDLSAFLSDDVCDSLQ